MGDALLLKGTEDGIAESMTDEAAPSMVDKVPTDASLQGEEEDLRLELEGSAAGCGSNVAERGLVGLVNPISCGDWLAVPSPRALAEGRGPDLALVPMGRAGVGRAEAAEPKKKSRSLGARFRGGSMTPLDTGVRELLVRPASETGAAEGAEP